MQDLADNYQQHFANWDEIAHPSILTLPKFLALIEQAVSAGQPITRAALEAEFGPIHWDEQTD